MKKNRDIQVALVGNPNTGKTSLFNTLTGLKQKVGNYPGITVSKKEGVAQLDTTKANIIDLPGTYSLNPNSLDETIVLHYLLDKKTKIDLVLVVAEVENLKRNLLIFTQIKNLGLPAILVINMADQMEQKGIKIDLEKLKEQLGAEVLLVSARKQLGIQNLKEKIKNFDKHPNTNLVEGDQIDATIFEQLKKQLPNTPTYVSWLALTHPEATLLGKDAQEKLENFKLDEAQLKRLQNRETIVRYQIINKILKSVYSKNYMEGNNMRGKLDRILTHRFWGYVIFFLILVTMFQSVFSWASIPMDYIDLGFSKLIHLLEQNLPAGKLTDLITQGIISGISGVLIFVPQIAILFFFIALLEETGYMSRAVFLMDRVMRRFGMSGKSVVPLVAGTACAVPAIMAARNIDNWRDRLITILVTPFTTCSARIPVYAIIIALVIPDKSYGIFNLQGLVLLALYMLGFTMALLSGFILTWFLKQSKKTFFIIEMPSYKIPSLKNVFIRIIEKTKGFVFGAGKIIFTISIILWFLASYGFYSDEDVATYKTELVAKKISPKNIEVALETYKLEHSYIGAAGKFIEPITQPLGYDWKIAVGLISSFAAREVFVGTMATLYSVGNHDDDATIKAKMAAEINPKTQKPLYNLPVGMSLLVFYAFAMQCLSTLAIVKKETNSWKWPLIQLFGMSGFAYLMAFITFNIFS